MLTNSYNKAFHLRHYDNLTLSPAVAKLSKRILSIKIVIFHIHYNNNVMALFVCLFLHILF